MTSAGARRAHVVVRNAAAVALAISAITRAATTPGTVNPSDGKPTVEYRSATGELVINPDGVPGIDSFIFESASGIFDRGSPTIPGDTPFVTDTNAEVSANFISPAVGGTAFVIGPVARGGLTSAFLLTDLTLRGGDTGSPNFDFDLAVSTATPLQWNGPGGGSWATGANWTGGSAPVNNVARFLSRITADSTVTLDGARSATMLIFDSPRKYTLAPGGGGSLTLSNAGRAVGIHVLRGDHKITAPLTLSESTTIDVAPSVAGNTSSLEVTTPLTLLPGKSLIKRNAGPLVLTGGLTLPGGTVLNIVGGSVTVPALPGGGSAQVAAGAALNVSGPVMLASLTNAGTAGVANADVDATTVGNGLAAASLSAHYIRGSSLAIRNNAEVSINPNGGAGGVGRIFSVTFDGVTDAWQGRLDLRDNDLIVQSDASARLAALSQITNFIKTGRNSAPNVWSGNGIASSAAATDPSLITALAVALNDAGNGTPLYATFDGLAVDANSILVKFTYNGDADLSGRVNIDDYLRIDRGFANQLTGYANGDFDYNGAVTADDFMLIDRTFLMQGTTLSGQARNDTGGTLVNAVTTPEPEIWGILSPLLIGRLRRRRSRALRRAEYRAKSARDRNAALNRLISIV